MNKSRKTAAVLFACIFVILGMWKACIPIIAMTANAFEEDKRAAIAAGMNGHIAKPIQVDKLLSTLAEMIRQQEI